jgi:hypothetical protein
MWHVWATVEVHTRSLWGDLSERELLEDLDEDERILLEWILK